MHQTIMNLLSEVKGTPELVHQLTPETDMINEVGLDSLQMINFILAVETTFDLQIDYEEFDMAHLSSINQFVDFLHSVKEKAGSL
ncbi:acyl carrier protein [Thermoflavimicrobium daqui]|nr:phosphopantetheine-binding protein [Thermoflavimicrobium daqui]